MTNNQGSREMAVVISSTMPSAKYSCSGSPLMFWNGSTAIDGLSGSTKGGFTAPPAVASEGPAQPHPLAVRHRAQFELHLQRPSHRREAGRTGAWRPLCARRFGAQGRKPG